VHHCTYQPFRGRAGTDQIGNVSIEARRRLPVDDIEDLPNGIVEDAGRTSRVLEVVSQPIECAVRDRPSAR
jgi:hypothetical protein